MSEHLDRMNDGDGIDAVAAREEQWAGGEHTTSKGSTVKLSDMPTPHLQNTINKFKGTHDTSALEAELDSRTQN